MDVRTMRVENLGTAFEGDRSSVGRGIGDSHTDGTRCSSSDDEVLIFEDSPLGAFLKTCSPDFRELLEGRESSSEETYLKSSSQTKKSSDSYGCAANTQPFVQGLHHKQYFLSPVINLLRDISGMGPPHVHSPSCTPGLLVRAYRHFTFSLPVLHALQRFADVWKNFVRSASSAVRFVTDRYFFLGPVSGGESSFREVLSKVFVDTILDIHNFSSVDFFCGHCCEHFDRVPFGSQNSIKTLLNVTLEATRNYLEWLSACLQNSCATVTLGRVKAYFITEFAQFSEALQERSKYLRQVLAFRVAVAAAEKDCPLFPTVRLCSESPVIIGQLHIAAVGFKIIQALTTKGLTKAIAFINLVREVRVAKSVLCPRSSFNGRDGSCESGNVQIPGTCGEKSKLTIIKSPQPPVDEVHTGKGMKEDDREESSIAHEGWNQGRRDLLLLAELRPKLEKLREDWEHREKIIKIDESLLTNSSVLPASSFPATEPLVKDEETFFGSDGDEEEACGRQSRNAVDYNSVAGQMAGFAPILEKIVSRMNETVFGSSDDDSSGGEEND